MKNLYHKHELALLDQPSGETILSHMHDVDDIHHQHTIRCSAPELDTTRKMTENDLRGSQ